MRSSSPSAPDMIARTALRTRCDRLGIVTVSCDIRGRLVEDVTNDHPAGVLLTEPAIRRAVEDLASGLAPNPRVPQEIAKGCWAWVIAAETRLSEILLVALMLEPGSAHETWLLRAMGESTQSSDRARAKITRAAKYEPASIKAIGALISGSLEDLHALAETRSAIRGFTHELSGAYETINLLYSLGRGMGDVTQANDFIKGACDKLLDAMPFDWALVRVSSDPALPAAWRDTLVWSGKPPAEPADRKTLCDAVVAMLRPTPGCSVLDHPAPLCSGPEPLFLAHPLIRDRQVFGAIIMGGKTADDPTFSSYDTQTLEAAGGYLSTFLASAAHYADQQAMFMGTIGALSASIDAKDRYTQGHSERVAHLSEAIAKAIGLPPEQHERIRIAGLVHDVGKIGVPEQVLTKQGRLTDPEFELIKLHPTIGHRILRDIPLLGDVLPAVLHHHERCDGRGYPAGLAGDAIPLYARIVAVADSFDAMSSTRSYRAAMPREKVLQEIQRCAGTQLDEALVKAFMTVDLSFYDELVKRHETQQALAA